MSGCACFPAFRCISIGCSRRPPDERAALNPVTRAHVATMAETIRRPRSAFDLRGISALAIYFALAALFFGRGLCGRWTTSYIGKGVDPPQLMWLMAWWPHALTHGLNPLFTDVIWAPHGLNLAWATSMPL